MRFGDFTAIERTSLEIGSGEFFSFLGPSGCGKTTLLNIISGFLVPSEGRVLAVPIGIATALFLNTVSSRRSTRRR